MLIKSIALENFRQFKGKQMIYFSTDTDKNVTVIKGENGAGKTTLLEAFRWCLYSEFNLINASKLLNTDIINKLKLNDIESVSVEINFKHDHNEYFFKRMETFIKNNNGDLNRLSKDATFKIKGKDGDLKSIKDEEEINNILPNDLSTYFFFDGERIENLSKQGNKGKKDLSQAVRNVLGLDVLLNAQKHLIKLSEEFEKDYKDNNTTEVEKIITQLNEQRRSIENYKQSFETANAEIQKVDEKIKDREDKIKANATSSQLQITRERLGREIINTESSINSLLKDIQKNNKDFLPEFLANKLLNLSSNKIDLSLIKPKGIMGIDGAAIDHIIHSGECICGQEIIEGSKAYTKLLTQKDFQPPASLGTIMSQFNEKTENVKNLSIDFHKTFNEKYLKIEESKEHIENISSEINRISEQLRGSENVKDLELERSKYINEKRELDEKLGSIKTEINKTNENIISLQKDLDKLALTNDRNKIIELRKRYTIELERLLSKYYDEKENKIRIELNKNVSLIFDKLIDTNHNIEINEDYTFRVVDIDGEDATSQGQDVITSFAFIGGLIDLAKKEHKEIEVTEPYPLLMDAPFAKLSKIHRRNVAKILPTIAEQFILFTVDSQYEGDIEETLKSKIGKSYDLIMHIVDEKYTEIR